MKHDLKLLKCFNTKNSEGKKTENIRPISLSKIKENEI